MALHAEATETFTTRELSNAVTLALNGYTDPEGFIRLEVLHPDGSEWEGYCGKSAAVFTGDSVRENVAWDGGSCTQLPEGVFCLRVTFNRADLYALYW